MSNLESRTRFFFHWCRVLAGSQQGRQTHRQGLTDRDTSVLSKMKGFKTGSYFKFPTTILMVYRLQWFGISSGDPGFTPHYVNISNFTFAQFIAFDDQFSKKNLNDGCSHKLTLHK